MPFGILAAVFATLAWSLNFVVPFVIGRYTIFDLALLRFAVSALIGGFMLAGRAAALRRLSMRDWLTTSFLAFLGYVGYFLAVTAAALWAGPVIAPAFLGLVPIVVALAGNYRQSSLPWPRLAIPLAVILLGLLLVNRALIRPGQEADGQILLLGIPCAILAVLSWTWFALLNQRALAQRPTMDSVAWTSMMLISGGVQMGLFLPVGIHAGLFGLASLGAGWAEARSVYLWGTILAVASSVIGVWAWTVASRRLPVALAAKLVVLETVFGVVFGAAVRDQWPGPAETIGMILLVIGVVIAIRVFYVRSDRHEAISAIDV
ncbi:MAG TPA: DMT family transporter [Terriglobia bacterium]|nr:DMT family transporter [Terriglobia bacterium]